ncbi:MAG: DMT family transporter [Bacteroidales bacterium]|nr:DMT family transporter [Bacteroidales bacterium]
MNERKNLSGIKVYMALLVGLSFMCFAAIFIKASHAPGIVTAFYRMAIASVVLVIPFMIRLKISGESLNKKGILLAVLAGLCFGIDLSLWSTGVVMSNATLPTLTANLAPVWVGFGSIIIFKEKHRVGFWIGLIIAFTGVCLLISNDLDQSNRVLAGVLLGVGAGIFYGIFYLFSQSGRKLVNTLSFLFFSTLSSAIYLLVMMLILQYDFIGYDRQTYLIFFGISLGVQVCGWMLINYSQGYLPASIVAPTLLGQPVLTAVLAALLLHEALTLWHISGGLVVVAGIYIVHYSRRR